MDRHRKTISIICITVVLLLIVWNCFSPKQSPIVSDEDLKELIKLTSE